MANEWFIVDLVGLRLTVQEESKRLVSKTERNGKEYKISDSRFTVGCDIISIEVLLCGSENFKELSTFLLSVICMLVNFCFHLLGLIQLLSK